LLDRNWRLAVNQNLTASLDIATGLTHASIDDGGGQVGIYRRRGHVLWG
jgi:hypothetical protein